MAPLANLRDWRWIFLLYKSHNFVVDMVYTKVVAPNSFYTCCWQFFYLRSSRQIFVLSSLILKLFLIFFQMNIDVHMIYTKVVTLNALYNIRFKFSDLKN
jgi:hypothetical protein